MTAAAVARMGELADDLCDQLDTILHRIIRNDPVLYLERESEKWHTVTDVANHGEVMLRAELDVCQRFMQAFLMKHPGSRVDWDSVAIAYGAALWREELREAFSVRVPDNVVPIRSDVA